MIAGAGKIRDITFSRQIGGFNTTLARVYVRHAMQPRRFHVRPFASTITGASSMCIVAPQTTEV